MPKHDKPQINWIDINKELPPIGEEVLVYSHSQGNVSSWDEMRLDTLRAHPISMESNCFDNIYFDHNDIEEVTHWSPRPNIPGEKVLSPAALVASKRKTVTKVCPGCGKSFECLPSAKACKECSPRLRRERFNKKHINKESK